jgi:hypothetical protein
MIDTCVDNRFLRAMALIVIALSLVGCKTAGFLAQSLRGSTRVKVQAEYRGLDQKTIAVMVIPNESTRLRFPNAMLDISKYVTTRLSVDVPGAAPIKPEDIVTYQENNPHWITLPYGELLQAMKVQRLVLVSLTQYTVHDPGNPQVWRGTLEAKVSVVESEAVDPDNFAYSSIIKAVYPPDRPVGLLNSDSEQMQLGMLKAFAGQVSGLFHDYEFLR